MRFRSRLEARWAAFFDLCNWPWEYEPLDLDGYIPDFLLPFSPAPVLVEVKPLLWTQRREPVAIEVADKIDRSGWGGASWLLGARLVFNTCPVVIGLCREPGLPGDKWRGLRQHSALSDDLVSAWKSAGNIVQWQGRGA